MKRFFLSLMFLAACNRQPLATADSGESLCAFAPGDPRAVLAVLDDHQVRLIHGDGSASIALSFDHAEARNFFGQALATRGGHIAAAASWVTGDGQPWNVDLALVDRGGGVLWRGSASTSDGSVQLFLNQQGALTAALGTSGVFVDAQGNARTLDFVPLAEPAGDGSVFVRSGNNTFGWLRPGASVLEPLGANTSDPSSAQMIAGRLTYLSPNDAGALVVSELPGDLRSVELAGIDASTVGITDHLDSGWVLVGEWRTPRYLVNVQTLEARAITVTLPADLRTFQGALSGPLLDADASLLVGLRDAWAGALYRSADGSNWERVGGTVSQVLDIDPLAHGGTYLVDATSGRYSTEDWSPPTAGHQPDYQGDLVQVVRPSEGVAQKLPLDQTWVELPSLQLSQDGRCIAYVDGQSLTAWNVDRSRAFTLETASASETFRWIE
jgi:hypothetical protein